MTELSNERIEQILHAETPKKEELGTILRGIYVRYMRLYENYLADIDALSDDKIAEFRTYHEETKSLVKYYYLDIPSDICSWLTEFENRYSDNLLGPFWHDYVTDSYKEFSEQSINKNKSEALIKEEFKKQTLAAFYETMGYIFRESFNTDSQTGKKLLNGITGLLFGKWES